LCSQAVAELSGMPALLSKLDGGTVAAINAGDQAAEPSAPAPNLLPSLLFAVAPAAAPLAPYDVVSYVRRRRGAGYRSVRRRREPFSDVAAAAGERVRADDCPRLERESWPRRSR